MSRHHVIVLTLYNLKQKIKEKAITSQNDLLIVVSYDPIIAIF